MLFACGLFTVIASDGQPPHGRIALYLAAVLASQMAIGVHNDYCDRVLDGAAKQGRAIPSGLISPRRALELTAVLIVLSVVFAMPLGPHVVALGVLGTAMGFLYNASAKSTVWAWAPFSIALPTMAVASFAVVDATSQELLLAYPLALPLVLPVYIADSLIDLQSDRTHGSRGLVARIGPAWARALCWGSLLLGFAIAIAFWPDGGAPGVLSAIALGLLGLGIVSDRLRIPRVHWIGVMLASVALAADWLLDIGA